MTTTSHQTTATTTAAGLVLAAAAAVVVPLSAFAPLGIAPLGAALAIAIAVLIALGRESWPKLDPTTVIIVAALLAWSAITVIWSIAASDAAQTAVRLAVIAVAGSLTIAAAAGLDDAARVTVRRAILAGVTLTVALMLIIALVIHLGPVITGAAPPSAILTGSDRSAVLLRGFNRTASVIALMAWPACAVAARRRPAWGVALFIGVALVLLLLNSSAPVLAVGLSSIVFAVAILHARAAAITLAVAIVLITAASPGANRLVPVLSNASQAVQYVNGSFNHRLQIWSYVAGRAAERPFTGWGLDASRSLGNAATVDVATSADGKRATAEILPLHPHNALLQVWVELGLPGAVLTASLLAWLVLRTGFREPDRLHRAVVLGAVAAGLVVAELSYGLWQGWWQATLWLTAAFVVATGPVRATA